MDLEPGFSPKKWGGFVGTTGTEDSRLAERRKRMFALIGEFQRTVAQPHGRTDAIRILQAILVCLSAYFAVAESLLDKLTAAGASPHRDEHHRILAHIQEALERCSVHEAKPTAAELAHVLDALVMHEAAIRFRGLGDPA